MELPALDRKEKWLVYLGSVLIVALGMLPNLIGWLAQTTEYRFNGIYYYWDDIATYMVTIRSGMAGNWRFSLFFTPLPQEGHYVKLFYLVLGNLFRGVNISPVAIYYLSLAIFNWVGCVVVYRFIAEFLALPKYRVTAFLLTIFGSGLGWLMILLGVEPEPLDMWLADMYPFLSMGLLPHFSAVAAGQLGFILLFLRYRLHPRKIYPLGMALIGLLLQTVQPFAPMIPFLVVGGIILGDWIASRRFPVRSVVTVGIVGLVQVPLLAYNYWVFATDPVWTAFGAQNQTLSPPFWQYCVGLFWFLLLCLPIVLKSRLLKEPKWIGLLTWVVGAMILAYLPWAMQRRFLLYYTLPLAIFATYSIQEIISSWLNRWLPGLSRYKPVLLILLVGLVGFSHIFWMTSFINSLEVPTNPNTFHPIEVRDGVEWLEVHDGDELVMVCTPRTGLLAGVYAYQKVYVAHYFETVNYAHRLALVEQFFQNEADLSALGGDEIGWIFYGPYERELGSEFQPPENFVSVFSEGDVTIYQRVQSP